MSLYTLVVTDLGSMNSLYHLSTSEYRPDAISVATSGFPLMAPQRHRSATVKEYFTGNIPKANVSLTAVSASLMDFGSVEVNFSIVPSSVNSRASASSLGHNPASGNALERIEQIAVLPIVVFPLSVSKTVSRLYSDLQERTAFEASTAGWSNATGWAVMVMSG